MVDIIALDHIFEIENYRSEYPQDHIDGLAASMRESGFKVEYAIVVMEIGCSLLDKLPLYGIVAGHCRTRAARLAGIVSIPVYITTETNPAILMLDQLRENENRRQPNPVDQAKGYKAALDRGNTLDALCTAIGKPTDYVNRRLWLLDLVSEAQKLVANGNLGIKYGEALHPLDSNFQRIALQAYNKGEVKTLDEFSKLCSQLLEKQTTCSLFDLALFNGKPIESLVDMSKIVAAKKIDSEAVIRDLQVKLEAEKKQRMIDRDYAKVKYAELVRMYQQLQAQVSGPLFAQIGA